MSGTFGFCPGSTVAVTVPPPPAAAVDLNGWQFTSRPSVPYQRTFKLMLSGLRWYLTSAGAYDTTTNPTTNARVLEQFYEANLGWDTFSWTHPHGLGALTCRFAQPLALPAGTVGGTGLLEPVEVLLVHHNPQFV